MSARASAERATVFVLLALGMSLRVSRARADDDVTVKGSQSAGFSGRSNEGTSAREITDAASLIEPLPGVHVRRLGADDSFATLSIRGSSSNEVSIVVAGVPLTDAADPTLDLSSLPLWPDATARVYRSFTPAMVGPGSLGGTLVLDPPRAFGNSKTEVWSAVGSFGAARMRASDVEKFAFGNRDAAVVTALSASRADDNFSYFDPKSGTDVERVNAQHAAVNGLVSVLLPIDWTATSPGSVRITTIAQARKQGIPGAIDALTPSDTVNSSRLIHVVELSGPVKSGSWFIRAYGRRDDVDTENPAGDVFFPTHTNDVVLATGAATGWRTKFADRFSLATTLDSSAERFAPGQAFGAAANSQEAGATRTLAGIGADLDFHATGAWTLSASARGDLWHDASDGAATAAFKTAPTNGTEAHPTAHLGTEVVVGPVTLAAHGGALARPASFLERFGSASGFLGDPTLATETAWTADAGARTRWHQGIFHGSFELDGFSTWADNLITFVSVGGTGLVEATNIGRARMLGAEADLALFLADFALHASYTGLQTINESTCISGTFAGACERPQLPGRPALDLFSDLTYRLGPAQFRYGVDIIGGMTVDDTGTIPNPTRVLNSAGARLDVPYVRGWRVAFDIRNLFDLRTGNYPGQFGPTAYPIGDSYNYPLPGRSFLLSVRYVSDR